MSVGCLLPAATSDLSASITRAISPPEATSLNGCGVLLLLAEKRNTTLSQPVGVKPATGLKSTSKRIMGIPRLTSIDTIFSCRPAALSLRMVVSAEAISASSLPSFAIRFSSSFISSSPLVMLSRRPAYSCASARRASTLSTLCFLSSE